MSADRSSSGPPSRVHECNLAAIRQAARHVTQFYDQLLAPSGVRATQFGILSRLRTGPMTINELAAELVMDRTTLGRNILPLQRDGLIEVAPGVTDRRRHELRITEAGVERHRAAVERWTKAQQRFSDVLGDQRAVELRNLLREVTSSDFAGAE